MLSDLSDEEFAALRSALIYAQELEAQARAVDPEANLGLASQPGEMSYAELADWFMTTPRDIQIWEAAALEKLRNHPMFQPTYL